MLLTLAVTSNLAVAEDKLTLDQACAFGYVNAQCEANRCRNARRRKRAFEKAYCDALSERIQDSAPLYQWWLFRGVAGVRVKQVKVGLIALPLLLPKGIKETANASAHP